MSAPSSLAARAYSATPTTVAVNQRVGPSGFADQGVDWQDLGAEYDVTGGTLTVRLTNAANGFVIADAVRIERLE